MSIPSEPPPEPLQPLGGSASAFAAGLRAGFFNVYAVVLFGTYIGIGALARDTGFSLTWSVLQTVLVWAGPAQLIFLTAYAAGAPLVEIAVAVALSAVRLLPMVVSLLPRLKGPGVRARDLLLPAHFIAITVWIEGQRLLPQVPREHRIAYTNGLGVGLLIPAVTATALGHVLAGGLPVVLATALLFLTPLSFTMSLARNARLLIDRLALMLGAALAPLLALSGIGLDLLWTGLIGGTAAYAIHRLRLRGAKP